MGEPVTLHDVIQRIGTLGNEETPEAIADAIGIFELLTPFFPAAVGPYASAALLLAKDAALAGKGADSILALRESVRAGWQAELDRRFPNG